MAREAGCPARAAGEAREREGGSNSVVESQPSKLLVAGSIPVSRSSLRSPRELRLAGRVGVSAGARNARADVAQSAERVLGKDEVISSTLIMGSICRNRRIERTAEALRALQRELKKV